MTMVAVPKKKNHDRNIETQNSAAEHFSIQIFGQT